MDVGLPDARLHDHLRDVGQDEQGLVRPHLVAHLRLALLGAEEHLAIDHDARHVGAHLRASELLLGQGQLARRLLDAAVGGGDGRLFLLHAVGGRRLQLAEALLGEDGVGARLRQLQRPAELHERVAPALGEGQLVAGPRHHLLRALQLLLRDEPFGEQRLQVLVGTEGLLQLALRVGHRRRRLFFVEPPLALLHVLQLQAAPLDLLARGREVLVVLDHLQLRILPCLREVGLLLGELGLAATDLLLEGGGVEEDQEIALLDQLPLGGDGHDLGLVALDGRGIRDRAQGLHVTRLHDGDAEHAAAHLGGGHAGGIAARQEDGREAAVA